jgi:nucleoside-diphosphate-sugar epimerase
MTGENKKILVTGADGFIGRALCRALLARGFSVRGTAIDKAAVEGIPHGVEPVVTGDISGVNSWPDILSGVDVVVHLAARVHVMKEAVQDPLAEFLRVNTLGTERLARGAAEAGCKKFIFMSSVKVNGESTGKRPFYAEDPLLAEDPYGVSKMKAEEKLRQICDASGMGWVVLRPTLVYGPGVKGNFIRLMKLVDRGVPLPFGAVRNRRSFIYVENLADAVRALAEKDEVRNEVFLVSDGQDVSTPCLIREMARAMGKRARLLNVPPGILEKLADLAGKHEEVRRLTGSLCVDIGKIKERLGWKAPFTLEEGIRETVGWFVGSGGRGERS